MTVRPNIKFQKTRVRISELADGWEILWDEQDPAAQVEKVETAAEALARVRRSAQVLAEGGKCSIFSIAWVTTSHVGQCVVRALQGR